jgi:hypothetical protein
MTEREADTFIYVTTRNTKKIKRRKCGRESCNNQIYKCNNICKKHYYEGRESKCCIVFGCRKHKVSDKKRKGSLFCWEHFIKDQEYQRKKILARVLFEEKSEEILSQLKEINFGKRCGICWGTTYGELHNITCSIQENVCLNGFNVCSVCYVKAQEINQCIKCRESKYINHTIA